MNAADERPWTAEQLHDLQADLADAADRIDQLLFELLLQRPLAGNLETLHQDVKRVFGSAPDITVQRFHCAGGLECLMVFDTELINQEILLLGLLERLARADLAPGAAAEPHFFDRISRVVAPAGSPISDDDMSQTSMPAGTLTALTDKVLRGSAVLCFSGNPRVLAIDIRKADKRAIAEPPSAPAVMGPHEGFIEDAQTNLGLIRRRLRTPRLRVEQFRLGTVSQTTVYLVYLNGITDDLLVAEARRRLSGINIDGVLDSSVVMSLIRDAPGSPVPTMQRSERPDRVGAALLQGQIAIVTDGTPFALLAPITLSSLLKASEDYYENWLPVSIIRCIRLIALLTGVWVPALYVAIVSYHAEFMPPRLLVTLAASRENVPLPSLGELLLLLAIFEIIREAGARVPSGIGSAVTIGGTLVVGNAAVRAGIISSPVIIIASAVVIAFFALPDYDLLQISRFALYPMLFAAGLLGLYGLLLATFLLAFYLASLRSFGVPFLSPFAPMRRRDWKDSVARAPWWALNFRPTGTGSANPVRQAPHQRPDPPQVGP